MKTIIVGYCNNCPFAGQSSLYEHIVYCELHKLTTKKNLTIVSNTAEETGDIPVPKWCPLRKDIFKIILDETQED